MVAFKFNNNIWPIILNSLMSLRGFKNNILQDSPSLIVYKKKTTTYNI